MAIRHCVRGALLLGVMLFVATPARADVTAFLGTIRSATPQSVRGVAVGGSMLVVGFEFEYADAPEDTLNARPSLKTGTFCGLVQSPVGRFQFYGTAGVGFYREALADVSRTGMTMAFGGGVKIGLVGPLRLRLDYRIITIANAARADGSPVQRFYVGANVKF